MNRLLIAFVFCVAGAAAQAQNLTPAQKDSDFRFLASLYATYYAPYEWKKQLLNFDVLNIKPADLPPGLTLGAVRSVAAGTQIEYGKYPDRNTFLLGTFRPTLTLPGALLERRFGQQTKARLTFEPRYLPQVPSLTTGLQPRVQQVVGALLFWTRSW